MQDLVQAKRSPEAIAGEQGRWQRRQTCCGKAGGLLGFCLWVRCGELRDKLACASCLCKLVTEKYAPRASALDTLIVTDRDPDCVRCDAAIGDHASEGHGQRRWRPRGHTCSEGTSVRSTSQKPSTVLTHSEERFSTGTGCKKREFLNRFDARAAVPPAPVAAEGLQLSARAAPRACASTSQIQSTVFTTFVKSTLAHAPVATNGSSSTASTRAVPALVAPEGPQLDARSTKLSTDTRHNAAFAAQSARSCTNLRKHVPCRLAPPKSSALCNHASLCCTSATVSPLTARRPNAVTAVPTYWPNATFAAWLAPLPVVTVMKPSYARSPPSTKSRRSRAASACSTKQFLVFCNAGLQSWGSHDGLPY
jgi:hypothetical protein